MDFIKVSKDKWTFEERSTGKKFFPFGSNFIFDYRDEPDPNGFGRENLHILVEDNWKPEIIKKAFYAAKAANLNIMKVFMAAPFAIDNNQTPGSFKFREMTPSLFERLDYLFEIAEQTGIYIVLTLSEWCMADAKWFHQGGTFFGTDEPGKIDSFKVYQDFWKALANHCKDKPALFSYNLAVELYLPAANWGAAKAGGNDFYQFKDEYGNEPFRRWLIYKYKTVDAVNSAWETSFKSIDEITQPEIVWHKSTGTYTMPVMMISDFNDFKECASYFFLKNQTDAIRSADPNHMITIGLHPDQPGIGSEGFAWKHCGIGSAEFDNFDYLTLHVYTNFTYLINRPDLPASIYTPFNATPEEMRDRLRECILYARFNNFGKPLILEEFGHPVEDDEECLEIGIRTVKELSGHVSGYQIWFLSAKDENSRPGPISLDFTLNNFGKEWAKLNAPGGYVETELEKNRIPAKTIVKLDRLFANVPDKKTVFEKIISNWEAYEHPVDFIMPKNETLAKMKADGIKRF